MAAYIPVPRDLTRVKTKVFFNLTKRQLICFGAGALMGVPSFFLLKRIGSTSLAAMGMILIMLPMFLLAMYERDGQPLEVFAKHFIEPPVPDQQLLRCTDAGSSGGEGGRQDCFRLRKEKVPGRT